MNAPTQKKKKIKAPGPAVAVNMLADFLMYGLMVYKGFRGVRDMVEAAGAAEDGTSEAAALKKASREVRRLKVSGKTRPDGPGTKLVIDCDEVEEPPKRRIRKPRKVRVPNSPWKEPIAVWQASPEFKAQNAVAGPPVDNGVSELVVERYEPDIFEKGVLVADHLARVAEVEDSDSSDDLTDVEVFDDSGPEVCAIGIEDEADLQPAHD